jgi:hypothetical protein|tara:strand:+ start:1092 stop:1205 length:114 start_codon:yes stop_codon:yes gene_type:complete
MPSWSKKAVRRRRRRRRRVRGDHCIASLLLGIKHENA